MSRVVLANNRRYTVVDDTTGSYWGLLRGAVVDELNGLPPKGVFAVHIDAPGMQSRVLDGGIFGVSGYPERSLPDMTTVTYDVMLKITAPYYRDNERLVTIPMNPVFPVDAGVFSMRRIPVVVEGRITEEAGAHAPIGAARVVSVDDPAGPPATDHLVAVRNILAHDHSAGVPVRVRTITPAGGSKQLVEQVVPGGETLVLSNRTGVGLGTVLRVGNALTSELTEVVGYAPAPASPALPGTVTVAPVLRRTRHALDPVQPVAVGPVTATHTLSSDAEAGDGVLLLNNFTDVDTVEIEDPPRSELCTVGVQTDSDGYYRFVSIGRAQTMFVQARATGFVSRTAPLAIDYERAINLVNFRLTP